MHKAVGGFLSAVCLLGFALPAAAYNYSDAVKAAYDSIQEEIETKPTQSEYLQLQTVFETRLDKMQEHKEKGELTESDKRMMELLDVEFPKLLNTPASKVSFYELDALGTELSTLLLEDSSFTKDKPYMITLTRLLAEVVACFHATATDLLTKDSEQTITQILENLGQYVDTTITVEEAN